MLTRLLANKHTTITGLVYGANWVADSVLPIWFPELAPKIHATTEQIRKGCFMYFAFMASDSKKPQNVLTPLSETAIDRPKTETNTSHL